VLVQQGAALSDFDFVFSLFGLLLGFCLIEVLGGLAKVIEAQLRAIKVGADAPGETPFRAGWLTPLLGLYIMLDVISFWGSTWVARDAIRFGGAAMLGGLLFAGSYYIAAHLVFPTEKADWTDLDAHYFRVRRAVFGTLIALSLCQAVVLLMIVPGIGQAMQSPIVLFSAGSLYTLLALAMIVRGKRANIAVLALLSLRYVFQYLT
jgi:hypothetical protein